MGSAVAIAQKTDDSHRSRFAITLMVSPSGDVTVRACEVINRLFRNRTSFGDNANLEEAFCPEFAEVLADLLDRLSGDSELIALPNFTFEVPRIALMRSQISATRSASGVLNVVVRFRYFVGAVNALFHDDIGLDCSIANEISLFSVDVLRDVVAPLLDICVASEFGSPEVKEQLGEFGRKVSQRSHELRFQAELLKRFIQQAENPEHLALLPTQSLKPQLN